MKKSKILLSSKSALLFFALCLSSFSYAQTSWSTEAENADEISKGDVRAGEGSVSGGQFVGGLDKGGYIRFTNVNVSETGMYRMFVDYITMDKRSFYVKINGQQSNFRNWETTGGWNGSGNPSVRTMYFLISLNEGSNTIEVGGQADKNSPAFDKIGFAKEAVTATTSWEAEDFDDFSDNVTKNQGAGSVSGQLVGDVNAVRMIRYNSIYVPNTGKYNLTLQYANADPTRGISIKVNNENTYQMICDQVTANWNGSGDPSVLTQSVLIDLFKGINSLEIAGYAVGGGNQFAPNMDKFTLAIDKPVSISLQEKLSFTLKPNPVSDQLTISGESEINRVEVYDLYGRLIVDEAIAGLNDYTLPAGNWLKGMYTLRVKTNQTTETYKVIKK